MNADPQTKGTPTCEMCGRYDARQFGDKWLCDDCYENCGSCCPEFGGFDLWDTESNTKDSKREKTTNYH